MIHRLFVCAMLVPLCVPQLHAQDATGVNLAAAVEDACILGVAFPRRILTSPAMELMPRELLTTGGQEELGIDPLTIDRVMFYVQTPHNLEQPPAAAFVIQFTEPFDVNALLEKTGAQQAGKVADGRVLYATQQVPFLFAVANPTTLVGGLPSGLETLLSEPQGAPQGDLLDLLRDAAADTDAAVVVSVDALRDLIKPQITQAPELPGPLNGLKKLPDLLSNVSLAAKVSGPQGMRVKFNAVDPVAAAEVEKLFNGALDFGRQMFLAQAMQQVGDDSDDPYARAMQQYLNRVSASVVDTLRPQRDGSTLLVQGTGNQLNIGTTGTLVALLLPAVQSAREAARRAQSTNNLRQIALAFHNYDAVHKKFPAQANYDADGKPLLSWRVHILPFLEHSNLYEQFKLDEPWDSEHNLKLAKNMPEIYRNPSAVMAAGTTNYLVPTGKGLFFDGPEPRRIVDLLDGTSNTIMVVEADPDMAVTWTQPADFDVDLQNPRRGLGGFREGNVFMACLADGSVRAISKTIAADILKALLTVDGKEAIPFDAF